MLTQAAEHLTTLEQIDTWLLELARPEIFDDGDPRNVLVAQRRSFGQLCAALAEHGYPQAAQLPAFAFQSALDYLKEKHRPKE